MNKLFAVSCLILNSLVAGPAFAEPGIDSDCYRLVFQEDGGEPALVYFRYSGDKPQQGALTEFHLSESERKTARVEPAVSQGAQQCEVAPSIQ